nr:putative ribonuclease H-like domain-containing protein [Tanacetum cinerariifolium]
MSSKDDEFISMKAFMVIAEDEPFVGKNDATSCINSLDTNLRRDNGVFDAKRSGAFMSGKWYVVLTGRVVVPTGRYVVPAGRVVVPTGRYVVPACNVIIVSPDEHIAVQRESNARTTLLQSIPYDNVADFHYMDNAKDIWNAVKARFGGNAESKKMRKSMLKQEFLEFRIGKAEGLHKGYDRMQKILSQLNQLKAKPEDEDINLKFLRALPSSWSQVALTLKTKGGLELLSFDDLYYKLKTLDVDVKGYTTFSSSQSAGPSHSAFVSTISSSKKMSYGDSLSYFSTTTYIAPSNSKTGSHRSGNVIKDVLGSFVADTEPEQQLAYEDFEQIEKLDLEEMDLKWKMAMLSVRVHKFEQKAGRKIDFDKKESAMFNKKKRYSSFKIKEIGKKEKDSKALITVDTLVDWTDHDGESDGVISSKEFGMIVGCDTEDAIKEGAAKIYNLITEADTEEASTAGDAGEFALMGVTSETKLDNHLVQTKKWRTSSKNQFRLIDSSMSVRTKVGLGFNNYIRESELGWDDSEFCVFTTNSEDVKGRPLYNRFAKADSMKVVPSPLSGDYTSLSDHIDLDESQMSYGTKSSTSSDSKSVSNDFVSCDDSDKSSEVNTNDFASSDSSVKSSEPKPNDSTSCALNSSVSTSENEAKIESNTVGIGVGPVHSRNKVNHQNPFVPQAVLLRTDKVNIPSARPQPVPTSKPKVFAPVPTGRQNRTFLVPTDKGYSPSVISGWWKSTARPKPYFSRPRSSYFQTYTPYVPTMYYNHMKYSGDRWATAFKPSVDPQDAEDKGVFDSGYSRSMTCNKERLDDFQEFQGGKVTFGGDTECLVLSKDFKLLDESMVVLKVPRKHNLYTINLNNLCPKGNLACLVVNASVAEFVKWHRRMGHVNYKNMNRLVKGKQNKASYKAINAVSSISEPLQLLHMDLFGPTSIRSIDHKYYCLVITDDYSRFCWVFFLEHKDETYLILKDFINIVENQLNKKVKAMRCDNGTEFKNAHIIEFCGSKGIKREYSNARTPQQNGVAERKNRTLIEAARTMLADSKLPIMFWTEAVRTACYVLNRVLVTNPHNKTPYALLTGNIPSVSHFKPFGCHVTILNTSDHLGKFDKKAYEGYIVGYYASNKAYRVYNMPNKRVEETMNLRFLEEKPNVQGLGHEWYFDLDYLTNTLGYKHVQANQSAGTQEATTNPTGTQDANSDSDYDEQVIIVPSYPSHSIHGTKPKDTSGDAVDDSPLNSADEIFQKELARLKGQEQRATSDAESLGLGFANDAEELQTRASAKTVPPSSIPVRTGSIPVPASDTMVSIDDVPVHTRSPTNSFFDVEPTTRFPSPSDLGNRDPSPGIFSSSSYDDEFGDALNNVACTVEVSPVATTRINIIHPQSLIIEDHTSAVQTRSKVKKTTTVEPSSVAQALEDPSWVDAMQEEMQQFKFQNVWVLVDLPEGKYVIGTKQEDGIDYDEVFAPVARIEVIRLFLAFASYMGFMVYQMDVKSTFLYGRINEEVYVTQPKGFVDPQHPKKVYKVVKALYGLHQVPRAWYATLSTFLLKHGYKRGTIDKTLFLKTNKIDIIIVQVCVDDIIFGSTNKAWCDEFEALMKEEFQMSALGELTFFLGLQFQQRPDGMFISQDKYVQEILNKFDSGSVRTVTTPYEAPKRKSKNESDSLVNVHLYRSIIGSLMYLTASRPDIMFAVSACSRNQVTSTTSNLEAVKKIFKKFTTGGCQFLGRRLISWQCKKQTIVATSSTEAEYVVAANYCGQVLWIQNQLLDYGLMVQEGGLVIFKCSTWTRSPELGPPAIQATIDKTPYTITKDLVRIQLQLADDGGIDDLPIAEIYYGMDNLGQYKVLRFSSKLFANMRLNFEGHPMPLLAAMLSQAQEGEGAGVAAQVVPQHMPAPDQPQDHLSTPLRQQTSDPTAPVFEHGQSSAPNIASFSRTHETDDGLSTNVEDAPLGGSFHMSPPRFTQAPRAGQTSGGAKDLITLTALSSVVYTLVQKVNSLETKLKDHKKLFKDVVEKLVKKVKAMEVRLRTTNRKIVMSDSDQEEGGKQDVDLDSLLALANAAVTVDSNISPSGAFDNPAASTSVPADVPTSALNVPTDSTSVPVDAPTGVAPAGVSNKGKTLMVEEDITVKERTFKQMQEDILASFSYVETLEVDAHEVESFGLDSEDLTLESLEAKLFVLTSEDLSLSSQETK